MQSYLYLLGWMLLPRLVARWLLTIWYGLTIRAGEPKPPPGSPKYEFHRRRVQSLVVAAYLLYTIFEADYDICRQGSFYSSLGVSPSAPDRDVKSRFRRLAALHHPDKVGSDDDGDAGAAYFMHLKTASETLLDGPKRFAYDRFGPIVLQWPRLVTIREFVQRGVLHEILPYYVIGAGFNALLIVTRQMRLGETFRWILLVALCVLEVQLATRPTFPPFLVAINALLTSATSHPPYLPFQLQILLRKVSLTLYIGLSQLSSLIGPQAARQPAHRDDKDSLRQSIDRLESLVQQMDADASRLVDLELTPFQHDASALPNLRGKMSQWLVQNTVRADPMVRDAVGTSLRRRRANAPAGARGTQ